MGEKWKQWQILLSWGPRLLRTVIAATKLKYLLLGRKAITNLDSVLKNTNITFADKGPFNQVCGFSICHVEMWQLDYKESWVLKNCCFWPVVLEKTLESPLDCREIKLVNPEEVNPEELLEGLMLKLKLQYFGHQMQRADSLEKMLMLGKIKGRKRRGRQDEMVGWHHRLNRYEFEQTQGDSEGQGSLVCRSPWSLKESDMT